MTPAQHRRGLRLQKLPASFVVPTERLPLSEGRRTFIRRVSPTGTVFGPEPIVPGGEEASRSVPAAGAWTPAREAEGVPERAHTEALAHKLLNN